MTSYIIKDNKGNFSICGKDYFKNRLGRQIELNRMADKKPFLHSELKDCLNNYVKGVVNVRMPLDEMEKALLKTCTDQNGIYLGNIFQEKRQIFLSTIFYNHKKTKNEND